MGLSKETKEQMQIEYASRLEKMARLAGYGRLIEGTLKIADQVLRGKIVAETLESLAASPMRVTPQEAKTARETLYPLGTDRERIELAVGLVNKLAHFDYYGTKNKIDKYKRKFGVAARLTTEEVKGPEFIMEGHLFDEKGPIDTITMWFNHSRDNLITEQFDYIEKNGYLKAAEEIIADAMNRIQKRVPGLAVRGVLLTMQRTMLRGEVTRPQADSPPSVR